MKKNFLFLFFLFPFFVYAEYTQTVTITLNSGTGNVSFDNSQVIITVPYTITMSAPSGWTGGVNGGYTLDSGQTTYETAPERVGRGFWCSTNGGSWGTATFTIVYPNYNTQEPEDPDPELPNPENPNPENPSTPGPWALESSLQDYMSNFQTFSQAFANWASSLSSDVRAGNQKSDSILNLLSAINNQQINDHDQRNQLHDDMKSFLGPLRDNVSNIKTGVDGLNTKASQSLTAQNLGNSYLASIDDYSSQIKDNTDSIDNKLSTTNNTLTSIKNSLDPPGVTSPNPSSQLSSLPSGSGFIQTVKNRLLPGYSFFTPSGDAWPSWTFTFSLSSFGLEDITVVLGGSAWQTAAGGKIVWMASIIRTLSKFAFYLIFFNAVIRALRQW